MSVPMYAHGGSGHVSKLTNQLQEVPGNDHGLASVGIRDFEERGAHRKKLSARAVPEHDVDGLEGFGNFARPERTPAGHIVAQGLNRNFEHVADDEGESVAGTHRDPNAADLWVVGRSEAHESATKSGRRVRRGGDGSP